MIIAVDFDGVLVENKFPGIGKANSQLFVTFAARKKFGDEIILWTCREGFYLQKAIEFCQKKGLFFDAVNENIETLKNKDYAIRKIFANVYLDDRNKDVEEFIQDTDIKLISEKE